jgi:hypothetical protein
MSDQDTSSKSWGSSVVIGIIILVFAVGLIFLIYFIFLQTPINPYPISPFKFGDTIQLSPAVFVRDSFTSTTISENQYLIKNTCCNDNCYPSANAPANSCVVTFSGNKADPNTKWILEELPYTGNPVESANQNVLSFGNRFYMRNTTNSQSDLAGRLRMNLFNSTGACDGLSPDKTFPIMSPDLGSGTSSGCYDPDTPLNQGNELIVYFWPTSQPDLFYILFPGTLGVPNRLVFKDVSLAASTNDGVVTLRPYSPWIAEDVYNPFVAPFTPPLVINNNSMLLNGQLTYPIGEKYPRPEVFLFKVVKV